MSKCIVKFINKYIIEKGLNINDILIYYKISEFISFYNAVYYDNRMIYLRTKNDRHKVEKMEK